MRLLGKLDVIPAPKGTRGGQGGTMRLLPTAVSFVLAAALFPHAARADKCKAIDTTIMTTFFVTGCESPVGVCTEGEVRSGPLKGTTRLAALTVREGPSPDVLIYTGDLVITTKSGDVIIRDAGVLDSAKGVFFELQQIVGGTKSHQNAFGSLTSQGLATATGFSGSLAGVLCNAKPHQHKDKDDDRLVDREHDRS